MLPATDGCGGGRRIRREHGFQLPLHPLQVTGWLVLGGLSTASFLLLVPSLPVYLQPAALASLSCLLLLHLAAHLAAALVDPAEPALRVSAKRVAVPALDRNKHQHAIEHGRCNLCRIEVSGARTKHCAACNKCVRGFDHHCKWLNNCVGARNYALFLMCVSTAIAAAALVAIIAVAEIAIHRYGTDSSEDLTLLLANSTEKLRPSSLPTSDAAFLAIVGALGILAAVTAGLLLHLCFFHIYISFLGLTTYEYIRQQRQQANHGQESVQAGQDSPHGCPTLRHRPINLRCEGRSTRTTFFTCAVMEETFSGCAEPTPTPPTTPQDCQVCVTTRNSVAPQGEVPNHKKVKTKWNCCAAVPDSPDDPISPTESRCLISLCKHKAKSKIPALDGRPHRPTHGHWSSAKLRVLFRVLGNLGNHRRRSHHLQSHLNKTNQVAPIHPEANDGVQTVNNLVPVPLYPEVPRRANALPSLSMPPRRRLISESELANALTLLQQQQQQRCVPRRVPSHYRRRRRSVVHRPKTPALSPIRESGLSNPASPSRQNCAISAISGSCT